MAQTITATWYKTKLISIYTAHGIFFRESSTVIVAYIFTLSVLRQNPQIHTQRHFTENTWKWGPPLCFYLVQSDQMVILIGQDCQPIAARRQIGICVSSINQFLLAHQHTTYIYIYIYAGPQTHWYADIKQKKTKNGKVWQSVRAQYQNTKGNTCSVAVITNRMTSPIGNNDFSPYWRPLYMHRHYIEFIYAH